MLAYYGSFGRLHRVARLSIAALILAGIVGALSTVLRAFPVGGRAYGVHVQNVGFLLGAPVSFGPAPLAEQPAGGGTDSDGAATINVSAGLLGNTPVLSTGPVSVTTTGNPATNTSTSTTTVNNLALLTDLLGATTVSASCSLGTSGFAGDVAFTGVSSSLLGFPTGLFATPAPNTLIDIAGLGTVVLNEQTVSTVAGMRVFEVNAMRITLDTGLLGATGSFVIAHAECSGTLPVVTSVAPASGPTGTAVTITGTNYFAPATVTIGGLAATSVSVVNSTTITAVVPPQLPAGAWDVTVTTPAGPGTLAGRFTSTNATPAIPVGGSAFGTQLTLLDALLSGLSLGPLPTVNVPVSTTPGDLTDVGVSVSVPGIPPLPTPFLGAAAFTVHTETHPAAGSVFSSAHSAGANLGAGLLSTGDIHAECRLGPDGFTGSTTIVGLQSTLLGDLSGFGTPPPNTTLGIAGLGTITLNQQIDATAGGVRRFTVNAIHLDVAPLGLSLGELILGQATCAAAAPTAVTIAPTSGSSAGGTTTIITGTNFTLPATVTFGGTPAASVTVDSATQITAVTPAHAAGNVAVVVGTPAGNATVPGGFTFAAIPAPTASSLAPASGTTAGGTTVVISGTNLTGASAVTFGGTPAASFTVDSGTQITAVTPPHAAGNVPVEITTPGGTAAVPGGFTYTTSGAPDLTVTVTGSVSTSPGDTLVYTIALTNNGSAAATGAVATAPVIAGLSGPTIAGGGCAASPCTLDVNTGATVTLTATYTLPSSYAGPTPIAATFTAAHPSDPSTGDNAFTITTPVVPKSDISLLMTVDDATPDVGSPIQFTVTATNAGPADASGIEVIDKLPVGLTFVSATPSQGTYDPATGRWSAGALANGAQATLQLSALVAQAGPITNSATRTGGNQIDPDSSDNIAAVTLNGQPSADVRVSMSASSTSVPFGANVGFTITVTNVGPSTATGLTVTDLLPAGLLFANASQNLGSYDPGTGLWTVGALASGAEATLIINATVNALGPIVNSAQKTAQTEADPAPNTDRASVTINGTGADLQLVMTSTPAPAPPGVTVTVDLTLTNLGPDGATGVGVPGALPGGLIFVSASAEQGSYDPGTNFWTVGTMPAAGPDAEARLRLTAVVPGGGVNTASPTAQGDQADPNPLNNNPGPLPASSGPVDLAASISMTGSLGTAGSPVSFNLGITNVGTGASVGPIDLQLALPPNVQINAAPAGWSCALVGQIYTCTHNNLSIAPSQQVTAVVGGVVTMAGSNAVPITVTVLYPPDQNLANNVASIPVPGGGDTADMSVTQSAVEAPAHTVTYQIVATNNGPTIATGTQLTVSLPASFNLASTSPASIVCNGHTTMVCDLGTMGAGTSATLTVQGNAPNKGPITTIAVITSAVPDSNNANNISSLTTTVQGAPGTGCPGDADCDGMPDACETQFGLDPNANDAGLDPDNDGRTNLQECTDGTHPRGFYTQIYAEGASGSFFDTTFALVNTDAAATSKTLVRLLQPNGLVTPRLYNVEPKHRLSFTAASIIGASNAEFSTTIESDVPVASSRTMRWDPNDYGMSLGVGAPSASTTWYFAEGSTLGAFQLFFLLVNPSDTQTATVTATFLKLDGSTVVETLEVDPHSRVTIPVKSIAGLENADVGAVFTSNRPVVVERAMYLNEGRVFEAGDAVAGVAAPATNWFIAEGANSQFFEYFLLLANPGTLPSTVTARYQREDGQTVTKFYTLPPTSRKTINVGGEDPLLTGQAVSTSLTATNPIVAERAMWWPSPSLAPHWYGGHQTMGSTQTSLRWAVAAGSDGGPTDDRTFVLIANQNATPVQARVTVIFDDGTSAEKVLPLAATSRTTLNIGGEFSVAVNRTFSVLVESIGAGAAPISVDVSRYRSGGGQFWAAGASSPATAVP